MNRVIIIGNVVRTPELRTTQGGISVCTFTVAVNRRRTQQNQNPEVDYFRVSAWRALGENCGKWLQKGKKVAVVGAVSLSTYTGQDGKTYANLEVNADDVEFLTPAGQATEEGIRAIEARQAQEQAQQQYVQQRGPDGAPAGFTAVETDELPFD